MCYNYRDDTQPGLEEGEDILVLYGDMHLPVNGDIYDASFGIPSFDDPYHEHIIDFTYSSESLNYIFNTLSSTLTEHDMVLFYFSSHGWNSYVNMGSTYGKYMFDNISMWSEKITARQVYIFDSCGAGGALEHIHYSQNPKITIIAATEKMHYAHSADQLSRSMGEYIYTHAINDYNQGGRKNPVGYSAEAPALDLLWETWVGEFSYHFISALRKAILIGSRYPQYIEYLSPQSLVSLNDATMFASEQNSYMYFCGDVFGVRLEAGDYITVYLSSACDEETLKNGIPVKWIHHDWVPIPLPEGMTNAWEYLWSDFQNVTAGGDLNVFL
jgi:hypothetical protein